MFSVTFQTNDIASMVMDHSLSSQWYAIIRPSFLSISINEIWKL